MKHACTAEGISDRKAALEKLSSIVEAVAAGPDAKTRAKRAHATAAGKFEDLRRSCAASFA